MNYLVLIPILFLVGSIILAVKAVKGGAKFRRTLAIQISSFMAVCLMCLAIPMVANAASNTTEDTATTSTAQTATTEDNAKGLGLLAAGLCTGIAGVGGGIAVGGAASAAIGATSEDPKNFGKSLIFVALGEGIAIYGLLVSILILSRI